MGFCVVHSFIECLFSTTYFRARLQRKTAAALILSIFIDLGWIYIDLKSLQSISLRKCFKISVFWCLKFCQTIKAFLLGNIHNKQMRKSGKYYRIVIDNCNYVIMTLEKAGFWACVHSPFGLFHYFHLIHYFSDIVKDF